MSVLTRALTAFACPVSILFVPQRLALKFYFVVFTVLVIGLVGCGSDGPAAKGPVSVQVELVDTFGGSSSVDGVDSEALEFGTISAIATSADGDLFVLDRMNNSISVISPEGSVILQRAYDKGEAPGEFGNLSSITVRDSVMYVLDTQQRQVKVLDSSLNIVRQFPISGRPTGLLDMKSSLLLTKFWLTSGENTLFSNDFSGDEKGSFFQKPPQWQDMAKTGNFERVTRDSDFNIYFAPPIPNVLYKLTEQGVVLDSVVVMEDLAVTSENRPANVTSSEFSSKGLAVHPNGFIFHLVQEGRVASINIYDEDLDPVSVLDSTQIGLSSFSHIAIDSRGLLYLSTGIPTPQVRKFNLKFSR